MQEEDSMRKSFLIPILVPALLMLAGAAYATHWGAIESSADCEGWSFDGIVQFHTLPSVEVQWEVKLWQDGMVLQTQSGTETVNSTGLDSEIPLHGDGMWTGELCGDFTATGTFYIDAEPYETAYLGSSELGIDFNCPCETPNEWGEVSGEADCDGWSFDGEIMFGTAPSATVDWEVVLSEGGMTVATHSGSDMVTSPGEGQIAMFHAADMWGMELCGNYDVSGTFVLVGPPDDSAGFGDEFECICEEPEVCNYTQGYWKNHEDMWPVMSLMLGDQNYDQADLLDILRTPPKKGDARYILAHQLIAAKLNVANGSDDMDIDDAISDGDMWLTSYPLPPAGSMMPAGSDREEMVEVAEMLDMWNNLHCDVDDDDYDMDAAGGKSGVMLEKSSAQVEDHTWGAVKGLYGK